jgi:hypothetical protein
MNKTQSKLATDKLLIRGSITLFALFIGTAYILYPHWVTFSHLALQLYTLPFFLCAMAVTIFLLLHTGKKLRTQELHVAGIAMYLSAACMGLVVLVPYRGGATQIALHNTATLFFVLFAAVGLAWLAQKLHDARLALSSVAQVGICIVELILLANFNQHPVQPWVWVALQILVTILLLLSLLRIFSILEKLKK